MEIILGHLVIGIIIALRWWDKERREEPDLIGFAFLVIFWPIYIVIRGFTR
jgi:hypothetical protein